MLSKCANPKCTATLRYLHQGRMYVVWPRKSAIALESRIEYRWLCDSCSRSMTLTDGGDINTFWRGGFRHRVKMNALERGGA